MHKLMVLIRRPADPAAFEDRWSREFVPLAERMPGLRRVALTRVVGHLTDTSQLHLLHEFFFDDLESVRAAMASPEGQRAGEALMGFAAAEATLCFADHMEMDVGDSGSAG